MICIFNFHLTKKDFFLKFRISFFLFLIFDYPYFFFFQCKCNNKTLKDKS